MSVHDLRPLAASASYPVPRAAEASVLRRSRWPFAILCLYLLSQGFMIPIVAVGPSWAVWPPLADFVVGLALITFLLYPFSRSEAVSQHNAAVFRVCIVILVGATFLFVLNLLLFDLGVWGMANNPRAVSFGVFQFYRLAQFFLVFRLTMSVPLTTRRLFILRIITDAVLIVVALSAIFTFFEIVPTSALVQHLPRGLEVAGPWERFMRVGGRGWGTMTYNHGYIALQLLMLVGLRIHLSERRTGLLSTLLLLLVAVAGFLSGSRAGFAAIILFMVIHLFRNVPHLVLLAISTGLVAFLILSTPLPQDQPFTDEVASYIEGVLGRQSALLSPLASESLSGRDRIWDTYLYFMGIAPLSWLIGLGFGAATHLGGNAHMLPLQILIEGGVLGLLAFAALMLKILKYLYVNEPQPKAVFWVTIALLFTSLTQETFYPVPAYGHFLGFYLFSVAIALRRRDSLEQVSKASSDMKWPSQS